MTTTAALAVGRIGGLAVALGIGAAVATGLAAAAWAAPDDPASAPSVRSAAAAGPAADRTVRAVSSRSVSTGPARRAATPAAAVDTAGGAAATSAASAPRASAAVSTTASLRRPAPVAPVTAPVEAPAPQPTITATTAPVTVAPAAARVTTAGRAAQLLSWLRPDPRGRLITIYKGTHFAIPNSFGFFIKQVSGSGTFTANSAYDLGDVDQFDWNKFTGITFTPLQPDRNSVMVGWRYNLQSQQFEIAPFYNVDGKRILPNENPNSPGYEVISVPADQPFTFTVDYNGVTLNYGNRTVYKAFPPGLTANVWTAARVSGWFGGNEVAPRTVSYFLKLDC